jgi:hypothetical protein
VALFATKGDMGAIEDESRRGVVKTDRSPRLFIVAGAAVGGKLAPVAVTVAVATRQGRAAVASGNMTTAAVHRRVTSAQREARLAVVERRCQRFPPIDSVAGGAVTGELALMAIGMAVTTGVVRQPAVPPLGVAAVAGDGGVAALQRKAGAAVVEGRPGLAPPPDGVASAAVAAQRRPVRITMAVAAGVVSHRAIPSLQVTATTGHLPMSAQQLESRPIVVVPGGPPAGQLVTGSAVLGELALVPIGVAVAALSETQTSVLALYVAGSAGHVGMAPAERKTGPGVVDGRRLPSRRCVAGGATAGELTAVGILVASGAVGGQAQVRGATVALIAAQAAVSSLKSVSRGVVVKAVALPPDERKIDAAMVGMTVNAAPAGQTSVVPRPGFQPGGQGLVALQALPFVQLLPQFMALGALAQTLQLRVGLGQMIGRQQLGGGCRWEDQGDN